MSLMGRKLTPSQLLNFSEFGRTDFKESRLVLGL